MGKVLGLPKSAVDIEREGKDIIERLVQLMNDADKAKLSINWQIQRKDPTNSKSPYHISKLEFVRSLI